MNFRSYGSGTGDNLCGHEGISARRWERWTRRRLREYIEKQRWDEDQDGFKVVAPTEP
jgi:hypothetical protein